MSRWRSKWLLLSRVLLLLGWPVFGAQAANGQPEPRVFKAGHYRLADGLVHAGALCLVSDNELLVKKDDAAEPQHFAASQVRNFVIEADSFTVLRKFEVVVNGVLTRYPCAMVRVCLPTSGLELYCMQGPMDVYTSVNGSSGALRGAGMGIRYGLAGVAVGAATGALLDKNPGEFQEQVMTVYLLRAPGNPELQTLQPKTREARDRMEITMADQPQLAKKVHQTYPSLLTSEKMLMLFASYEAAKSKK